MRSLLVVYQYPAGPRVWLAGQRVHHGATGALLALCGLAARRRALIVAGAALATHDRHDWRVWIARERPPTRSPNPKEAT